MPAQTNEISVTARNRPAAWLYATRPTRWTIFLRTFVPWQIWRFVWINAKMLGMIRLSHRGNGHC